MAVSRDVSVFLADLEYHPAVHSAQHDHLAVDVALPLSGATGSGTGRQRGRQDVSAVNPPRSRPDPKAHPRGGRAPRTHVAAPTPSAVPPTCATGRRRGMTGRCPPAISAPAAVIAQLKRSCYTLGATATHQPHRSHTCRAADADAGAAAPPRRSQHRDTQPSHQPTKHRALLAQLTRHGRGLPRPLPRQV
jgi:hypothetical protein